ncbi:hypothetical protein QBC46DRAFT_168789 [Diplogelasinospora grovesii]|uniref:Uncharacterized protein n=1 Tax=Diplogelasinospora grovesii TaxID=303347 RepID=A0AAN6N4E8_9PEZI|nr:hypothetical protein QBC46DRAFT_168789 [Diplogelasinospora grovesii]
MNCLRQSRQRLTHLLLFLFVAVFTTILLRAYGPSTVNYIKDTVHVATDPPTPEAAKPKYKPTPTYIPPPVKDPFPLLLATSTPPPVPKWNKPRKNLHKNYDLPVAPPLLIGFTRTWPILLQAVVSYITAGWPPSQIYVVENTGVQQANARGQLTLQNPFYLNHTTLEKLGVNIVQTPVLLSFAQLQNFYLSLSYANDWPYYFWSHMDVLVLSFEDGLEGITPAYSSPGYKTVYELCCSVLNETRKTDERWGLRFFAYDHLALVNPKAYEDVGGWDTLIPYYITDCDMHSRLHMANWTVADKKAGIVTDVGTALDDLQALYRVPGVSPTFTDPNPPPPPPPKERGKEQGEEKKVARDVEDENLGYWRALHAVSDSMFHYKHGERGRNTWQTGQRGGKGEPFYYDAAGLAEGIDVITEAGKEVFRRKWGHRDCDLITGAGLGINDQWQVEKDWE